MQIRSFAFLAPSLVLISGVALAQEPAPAGDAAASEAPVVEPAPASPPPAAASTATPEAAPPTGASGTVPAPDASAAASASAGDTGSGGKFTLALRPPLGWGIPMGSAARGSKLSELVVGQIPIWVDVGYLVTPELMVGVYGQYGIALPNECPGCSGSDIRFGVQGQYHFLSAGRVDPWVGLGVGYEILSMSGSFLGYEFSTSMQGMEFANLQVGLDFRLGSVFRLGPFASFSLGEYSNGSVSDPTGGETSGSIDHKTLHEWLTLGTHAAFYF